MEPPVRPTKPARIVVTALEALLVLVVSSALINFVMGRHTLQRETDAANSRKFHSFYDPGRKSMDQGDYAAALAAFDRAEQSLPRLNDDQYAALKTARLKIAARCQSSGLPAEAQDAYAALVNSGLRQGSLLLKSGRAENALARFQDARQFAGQLASDKPSGLIHSGEGITTSLRELHRYPDALDSAQNLISYVRAGSDQYDPAITSEYLEMSRTYAEENDWPGAEQALVQAWGETDKRIDHFSALAGADESLSDALADKDYTLYNLVVAYQHDGKTDSAIATAEALFNFIARYSKPGGDLRPYSRKDTADLALRIATQANRQDAVKLWRQRRASIF
jgi:tetratricopeptide (TPR) repeat protein